jgi:hypothetical protein
MSVRYWTNELLAAVEDGNLDGTQVLKACLGYMSEADVKDLCSGEGYDEVIGVDAYCDEFDEDEIAGFVVDEQPFHESPFNRDNV